MRKTHSYRSSSARCADHVAAAFPTLPWTKTTRVTNRDIIAARRAKFNCYKVCCPRSMEPTSRPNFQLAGAGGVLFGVHRGVHRPRRPDRLGGGERRVRARLRRGDRHPGRCGGDDSAVPGHVMSGRLDATAAAAGHGAARDRGHGRRRSLALPVFLSAAGGSRAGRSARSSGSASQAFGCLLHRLHTRTDNLAAAGVAAFGMMFRAIAVMVVVLRRSGVRSVGRAGGGASCTRSAYTAELGLSLVAYYIGPRRGQGGRVRRLLLALVTLALVAPANAFARGEFDPTDGVRAARVDPDPPRARSTSRSRRPSST